VHGVVGKVFGLDGLEGAGSHMQGDAGALHALGLQGGQNGLVEMQGGGRCGYGTRVGCEHGLVALAVFFFIRIVLGVLLALDVGRQRQVNCSSNS
jgi:hypothetical protein